MRAYDLYETLSPLDYALPLALPNKALLEEIRLSCSVCSTPHENPRGELTNTGDGYLMRALNWCEPCERWRQSTGLLVAEGAGFKIEGPRAGEAIPLLWKELESSYAPGPTGYEPIPDPEVPTPEERGRAARLKAWAWIKSNVWLLYPLMILTGMYMLGWIAF